jgi:hypothetical protein
MIADDVVDPDLNAAISVHRDFGMDEAQARQRVSDVVRAVDGWREHFRAQGVTAGDVEALAEFIDRDDLRQQRDAHRDPVPGGGPRRRSGGTPKVFR